MPCSHDVFIGSGKRKFVLIIAGHPAKVKCEPGDKKCQYPPAISRTSPCASAPNPSCSSTTTWWKTAGNSLVCCTSPRSSCATPCSSKTDPGKETARTVPGCSMTRKWASFACGTSASRSPTTTAPAAPHTTSAMPRATTAPTGKSRCWTSARTPATSGSPPPRPPPALRPCHTILQSVRYDPPLKPACGCAASESGATSPTPPATESPLPAAPRSRR